MKRNKDLAKLIKQRITTYEEFWYVNILHGGTGSYDDRMLRELYSLLGKKFDPRETFKRQRALEERENA